MSKIKVTVIDYGMGNLLSVQSGFEHCGATVTVTNDHDIILSSDRVVLPGVGAFADGMAELSQQKLDQTIRAVVAQGTPFLGICLGMQMMLDESEEFGSHKGLGLISGQVIPIPNLTTEGKQQKIPHIGWNSLVLPRGRESWTGTLLQDNKPGDEAYFVHSFMANPINLGHRIADCLVGGVTVSACIGNENVLGCQFHPEKSGEVGLKILRRFLKL